MANLIELIKTLRDRTGAGFMDCKNALVSNNEDIDLASDWLRKKGLAKAAKKADRIAAEGLALAVTCEKCGKTIVLEVNCETDFVAKGDDFNAFVKTVAELILKNNIKDLDTAKSMTESMFVDATVKMGEKFDLRRFTVYEKSDNAFISTYIHMGGKIATAVLLDKDDAEFGQQIAMHITANNPAYITVNDIPEEVRAHEIAIQKEAAKTDESLSKKDPTVLQKIIEGKVNKFFAETTLDSQPFLFDDTKTVGRALKEKNINILKYVRYQVGEGIEKRKEDFASEVMNQTK